MTKLSSKHQRPSHKNWIFVSSFNSMTNKLTMNSFLKACTPDARFVCNGRISDARIKNVNSMCGENNISKFSQGYVYSWIEYFLVFQEIQSFVNIQFIIKTISMIIHLR